MVTVGENGDVVEQESTRDPPTRERIVLRHYATRSRREYEVKLSWGDVMLKNNHRGSSIGRRWRRRSILIVPRCGFKSVDDI